ncbi:MAG: hypothetical protein BGO29_00610 [Bacteroidales bacterium 36-12]|nr:MAG: hypothetical protein BGO29_00610 [Bacteroidales bacterium 36-12]
MFTVVLIMLSGVLVGLLLQKHKLTWIYKVINMLIWLLLFLLGIEVGSNKQIIQGFAKIGFEAILIGTFAVIGSVIAAAIFYRWKIKKQNIK